MEVSGGAQQSDSAAEQSGDGKDVGAIFDLLFTVGHIDGPLHTTERAFIDKYVDSVLLLVADSAQPGEEDSLREEWRAYLAQLCAQLDTELGQLVMEAPEELRSRALTVYRALSGADQETAMELLHGLILVDGDITPPEQDLYTTLLQATHPPAHAAPETTTAQIQALPTPGGPPPPEATRGPIGVNAPISLSLVSLSDPVLDPLEHTLSPHPVERKSQIEWDHQLIASAITTWQKQRALGNGRLAGLSVVDQIPVGARFLDGHVYAMRPDHPVELVVLGDVHGCYSCLKAALLQTNFVQRVWAHQWHPERFPDVKLVLLGDYIDRGLFSFDGVLRAVLQLFVAMPDHVFVLRGNHEHLRWFDNRIISGVHPAEALASIAAHVPIEMLDSYRILFEHMPTSLLCDHTLFVHAGIPRDDSLEARYRDLSSLNDAELRFQMMWSDPVQQDRVPLETQRQNPRFDFGRDQFVGFMQRLGMNALIRGHEKIDSGFQVVYDTGEHMLLNLFSAGGKDNCDLPKNSSYRTVTPMALSMHYGYGNRIPTATPWALQYHAFNYPPHNGLYRPHPVLPIKYM